MGATRVREILENALSDRIGSGIAASFGKIDALASGVGIVDFYLGRHGHDPSSKASSVDSFFDLASLTKILCTTLLIMKRVEEGTLSLDQGLGALLPRYCSDHPRAAAIQLKHLLHHSSGLPAWRPFYESVRHLPFRDRKSAFDDLVLAVGPETDPGNRIVYSDLGFLLLERILGSDLDRDFTAITSRVPGLGLHFRPLGFQGIPDRASCVMTENCPWRGMLQGEVHDDNTWSRGGVAGHAGLFGRLSDVKLWIQNLHQGTWVNPETLRLFSRRISDGAGAVRALGFDVPPEDRSGSTGDAFSLRSIGHLGFTGTSLWMDLESGDYAILLTNRVHPSRMEDRIQKLRRDFHLAVRSDS